MMNLDALTQALSLVRTFFRLIRAIAEWPWTPLVAGVLVCFIGVVWITTAHRRWKHGWLSGFIDAQLAATRGKHLRVPASTRKSLSGHLAAARLASLESWDKIATYFRNGIWADLKALHLPSVTSFLVITFFTSLFFLLPRPPPLASVLDVSLSDWWHRLSDDFDSPDGKAGDRIIGAFTGLAVVVIALIVFVAESIRDSSDSERKRVLVRVSWLWPLGLAATLFPFGFLWSAARGFTVLLEVIVAAITLWGFAQVIRNLLDPEIRERNRVALLRERVRRMILESVRERVGNNILLERLGSGKLIDTLNFRMSRAWLENDTQQYYFVDAPRDGWLADIQLSELKTLGEKLDRYAREALHFGLTESGPIPPAATNEGVTTTVGQRMPVQKAYLLKRYREEVPPDSIFYSKQRTLFALPEGFRNNPALLADLRAAIPHIFRFTDHEPSSVAFRREMKVTKDQLSEAARSNALGSIEELRQIYLRIAEEFLTLLADYGGGFSADQAAKERGNFFEGWTEIRWLTTDLRELIIVAADGNNTDVLGMIAYLPFAISARSLQARDHLLFQEFLNFAPFLYFLVSEGDRTLAVRRWMIDKCWRWPREIAEVYIAGELDNEKLESGDLDQMRDFALYSCRVLQDLLKLMADKRDAASFAAASRDFRKLFSRFRGEHDQVRLDILRFQIERAPNAVQRESLKQQLTRQEKRHLIASELNTAIDGVYLAIGGRLLAKRLKGPADDAEGDTLLETVREMLPDNLTLLTAAYAKASEFRVSDYWGWNHWDSVVDGEAHFVDTHTNLNQIFTMHALTLLERMPPESRQTVKLPSSHSLAEMAREGNPQGVLPILDRIEREPGQWELVVTAEARARIGDLRRCLATARMEEESQERARTRDAILDPVKVAEFRTELTRTFSSSGRMRAILTKKGAVNLHLRRFEGSNVPSLGYSQLDDKDAFIAQEHTSYSGWGRGYGEGLAQSEDEIAFAYLVENAGEQRPIVRGEVVTSIDLALANTALNDPIVLQSLEFGAENAEIRMNAAFVAKHDPRISNSPLTELNGFMGLLTVKNTQVPVFDAFVRREGSANKVIIVDVHEFMRWNQFAPNDTAAEQDDVTDILLIRVVDLNQDEEGRERIVAQKPVWLEPIADKTGYLRGRVLVNVYEKFQLEALEPKAAICLRFRSEALSPNSE